MIGAVQPPGSLTVVLILAWPCLLKGKRAVSTATLVAPPPLQTTLPTTSVTPSAVPLTSAGSVESLSTRPLTSISSSPPCSSSALPEPSFQVLPQELTPPIAVPSLGQATMEDSRPWSACAARGRAKANDKAQAVTAGTRKRAFFI